MDQQLKISKAERLDHDLSIHEASSGSNFSSNSSCGDKKIKKRDDFCEEELKIRGELEHDIERNLEEEIKDGIYHLALRLHRLYLHQKERDAREAHDLYCKKWKNKVLSEINISIRMEEGTKIEIKESKKEEDPDKGGRPWTPSSPDNMKAMLRQVSNKHKKFDWANSLRSGTDPGAINKKNSRLHKTEMGWKC